SRGPTVTPAGAAFWHPPSQKLFAVKPGVILVTWPLLNGQVYNWQASVRWPTNEARFQIHVASPTLVDVSDGGAFSQAVLHATSTDDDANAVSQSRSFSANLPGNSLLMLSAGNPSSNAIRFQLVRTITWNDPAQLHDNAPAIVGQPIVDPGPYHNPACCSPQFILTNGHYCSPPVFDLATRNVSN